MSRNVVSNSHARSPRTQQIMKVLAGDFHIKASYSAIVSKPKKLTP